jgi:hydroxypyruvate isomerase
VVRFDANLSILFPDMPLLERPAAAAALGFDAVELWWPFPDEAPAATEVDRLVDAIGAAGLTLVALNLAHGDRAAGEHGLAAIPGQEGRFCDSLEVAVAIAGRLGCVVFNALYGSRTGEFRPEVLDEKAVESLAFAAGRAKTVGATVVLEALNPVDFPRYGLHRTADSIALADRVLAETGAIVKVLFDVYNVQRSEGDLITRIELHAARFGHVQVADVPARLHPGSGEIAFERVLPALARAGYNGYVGLEYRPSPDPAETFAWLPIERRNSRPVGP